MRTPLRRLPDVVASWTFRARWLRWLDALAALLVVWSVAALLIPGADGAVPAALATAVVAAGAPIGPVRARWRPVSGAVGLAVSRSLRPGDRAWYVKPGGTELVLITARRGMRMVVARSTRGPVEGIAVHRTRVLLVPADLS